MKIFSIILTLLVQFTAIGMEVVEIRPMYAEGERFFIRRPDNINHKLLKFRVKIDSDSIKKESGNLTFYINLIDIEVADDKVINPSGVKIENDGSYNLSIKYNNSGTWESDPIKIVIPEKNLLNTPFKFDAADQIRFRIGGMETFISSLTFDIIPALSITIPDNERVIRFGKITYDNGLVRSARKSAFHLNYKCIAKAELTVDSDTDFHLKSKNGGTMPVRISLLINGSKEKISSENLRFLIPSDRNNFDNCIEGKCYIKYNTSQCPPAGIYKTVVMFTIQPQG